MESCTTNYLLEPRLDLGQGVGHQRAAGEARLAVGAVAETALADGDDFDVGVFTDFGEVKGWQSTL